MGTQLTFRNSKWSYSNIDQSTIYRKMKSFVVLAFCIILGTGIDALSGHERNHLRADNIRKRDAGGHAEHTHVDQPTNCPDIDMFDVTEEACKAEDWGEHIDSWDLVAHDLDQAECGKHLEGWKCLCRAYFSVGAIDGPPQYICEHCARGGRIITNWIIDQHQPFP